jgi:hypothetical protein
VPPARVRSSSACSTEARSGLRSPPSPQFGDTNNAKPIMSRSASKHPVRRVEFPVQPRAELHGLEDRSGVGQHGLHCLDRGPLSIFAKAGCDRYAREYVPRSELPRVRRWIRRARAETALG